MAEETVQDLPPDCAKDWIGRARVARILGVSERTAQTLERNGKLRCFEHGFPCGRRKYSRTLVERQLRRRWEEAIRRQDQEFNRPGDVAADARTEPHGEQVENRDGIAMHPELKVDHAHCLDAK